MGWTGTSGRRTNPSVMDSSRETYSCCCSVSTSTTNSSVTTSVALRYTATILARRESALGEGPRGNQAYGKWPRQPERPHRPTSDREVVRGRPVELDEPC